MKKSSFSDFWYWWRTELSDLASNHLPAITAQSNASIVHITAAGILFSYSTISENAEAEAAFPLVELEKRLVDAGAASVPWKRQCRVRLGFERFILRRLSGHALPASQLASAAELDLESCTPFVRSQVHVLPVFANDRSSNYAIVKNSILQPVLDAIQSAGWGVSCIEFEMENGAGWMPPHASGLLIQPYSRMRRRIAATCMALLIAAAGATAAHGFARNQTAIALLQGDLEQLKGDAKIARQALDVRAASLEQIHVLRKSIEGNLPVAAIWDELARVLPDSAYLTDLSVKGTRVSIAGFGEDAAGLVVALEQSPFFSQATFVGPVTRSPGIDGERFEASLVAGAG